MNAHGLLEGPATAVSRFQSQYLNTPVLSEVVIEGEGPFHATGVEHRERDSVAEGPILVRVSSEDLSGFLFLGREDSHDRQPACQEPLTCNCASELA